MARIKIQMPDKYLFTTQIKVRITDINYGNHLGNDSLLSIIHEARMRFLKSINYSEDNVEGMVIMLADAAIIYKSQAFYGDELTIEIGISEISKKSCDLYYHVTKADNKTVALCKTAIVFYDYKNQKPARIPAGFLEKLDG